MGSDDDDPDPPTCQYRGITLPPSSFLLHLFFILLYSFPTLLLFFLFHSISFPQFFISFSIFPDLLQFTQPPFFSCFYYLFFFCLSLLAHHYSFASFLLLSRQSISSPNSLRQYQSSCYLNLIVLHFFLLILPFVPVFYSPFLRHISLILLFFLHMFYQFKNTDNIFFGSFEPLI